MNKTRSACSCGGGAAASAGQRSFARSASARRISHLRDLADYSQTAIQLANRTEGLDEESYVGQLPARIVDILNEQGVEGIIDEVLPMSVGSAYEQYNAAASAGQPGPYNFKEAVLPAFATAQLDMLLATLALCRGLLSPDQISEFYSGIAGLMVATQFNPDRVNAGYQSAGEANARITALAHFMYQLQQRA